MSRQSTFAQRLLPRFAAMLAFVLIAAAASAQTTFHDIGDFIGSDGQHPVGNLVFDSAGNLYGVNFEGGNTASCGGVGCGTVFELSPTLTGWQKTVLYTFTGETDGSHPLAGLVLDNAGNVYGTASYNGQFGAGVVFELAPASGGSWIYTVLYTFSGVGDGRYPQGNLIIDSAGNLYGTTGYSGTYNDGAVFELSPNGSGGWKETVIYGFPNTKNGNLPYAGVIFDAAGNLYGTTTGGGNPNPACLAVQGTGCGVVFKLSLNSSGKWSETGLFAFNGENGMAPYAGVTIDAAGNLYGTTRYGGNLAGCESDGCGLVYKLSPASGGKYTETVIHIFEPGTLGFGHGGSWPAASLSLDASGNLFGTTIVGGTARASAGTVFELSPVSGGMWPETLLHSFTGGTDGGSPYSGVIFDASGNLFGTASYGGDTTDCSGGGCGTVFRITP